MKEKILKYERCFLHRAHPKSLFEIELLPGVKAGFGEPKSKLNSKKYQLTYLKVDENLYKKEFISNFLKRFHVKYINSKHLGKKLPLIYRVIGSPERLVRGGYIVICEPNLETREALSYQQTYDFWINQFYKSSVISSDENTLNEAIPILINKIATKSKILDEIPHKHSRIFEEIIAEVFCGFGYVIELTKKTRDGGKDIIALKKTDGGKEEKLLIECKHWKDKVNISTVRELVGVAVGEDDFPTGIILATTNKFTRDAKKYKINQMIPIELELKDYEDIIKWIKNYNAIQFKEEEMNRYTFSLGLSK